MRRKPEFSKVILVCVSLLVLAVTGFTGYMVWKTNDLSPLMYMIPAVFTELATATGYYFWKAKQENVIKLQFLYGKPADKEEELHEEQI